MKVPVDYFGTEFTQVIVLKGKNCATIRHFNSLETKCKQRAPSLLEESVDLSKFSQL